MSNFDPQTMDSTANEASIELENIREEHPDSVKAVAGWMNKMGFIGWLQAS